MTHPVNQEAFREFFSAFTDAENAISQAETLGGQIEDGARSSADSGALLITLGLLANAKAIQAQTLGLRLAAKEASDG